MTARFGQRSLLDASAWGFKSSKASPSVLIKSAEPLAEHMNQPHIRENMACLLCFSTMQVRNLSSRCDACLLGRSECLETLLIASASQVQWLCSTSCRPATFRYAYQQKQLQDPFFRTVHLLCDLLCYLLFLLPLPS